MVAMAVFDRHVGGRGPVDAARDDDRHLAGEIDERLEDTVVGSQAAPGPGGGHVVADPDLPLAVVTHSRGLKPADAPHSIDGGRAVGHSADPPGLVGPEAAPAPAILPPHPPRLT